MVHPSIYSAFGSPNVDTFYDHGTFIKAKELT